MLLCNYKIRYLKSKLLDYIVFWSKDTLKVNNFHFPLNLDDAANICSLKLVDGTPLDNVSTRTYERQFYVYNVDIFSIMNFILIGVNVYI